jgi:hypothetical protein
LDFACCLLSQVSIAKTGRDRQPQAQP